MGLEKIFSNNFETSENAASDDLTTHYYSNDYEKVKNTIIDISKGLRYKVVNINDTFQEILIKMPKGELIITLFNPSYSVTSVDCKVSTSYLLPFNRGAKVIKTYYEALNKQLTLKKIGGGNEYY